MRAIQAIAAVLTAVATAAAVWGIKRGVEWGLQGASDTTLNVVLVVVFGPLIFGAAWLWVLKPLVDRRKERQQPGRGESVERQAARD